MLADQQYFGLEAKVLRAGAARALERISTQPPEHARIDIRNIGDDFRLDAAASATLLSAFLAGGLVYPDGAGRYHPTRQLREYALACVVAPLPRARAKGLIDRACSLAAIINSDWDHIPFQIEMIAVSGGFMSRRDQLSDLSLSLALGRRAETQVRHSRTALKKEDALRQVLEAVRALSSFIVVGVVEDRRAVPRPFSVVFQASACVPQAPAAGWDRLRDWSASVTRWLAVR